MDRLINRTMLSLSICFLLWLPDFLAAAPIKYKQTMTKILQENQFTG